MTLSIFPVGGGGGSGGVTAADIRYAYILKNDGAVSNLGFGLADIRNALVIPSIGAPIGISSFVEFEVGDFIQVYGYHEKGSPADYQSQYNSVGFSLVQDSNQDHSVLVRTIAPTSIPSGGGGAAIVWGNAAFDTDGYWSGIDPTRLRIPNGRAGKYIITVSVAALS